MLASNNSLEQLFGWSKYDIIPNASSSILYLIDQFLMRTSSHYHNIAQKAGLLRSLFPSPATVAASVVVLVPNMVDCEGYDAKLLRKAPADKSFAKRH